MISLVEVIKKQDRTRAIAELPLSTQAYDEKAESGAERCAVTREKVPGGQKPTFPCKVLSKL